MSRLPIVPHHEPNVTTKQRDRALHAAAELAARHPRILPERNVFKDCACRKLADAPTLLFDDFSDIVIPTQYFASLAHLEDRARMRAGDGDLVVSSLAPSPGYEPYCRQRLALGKVTWLCPTLESRPDALALAAWRDRRVRAQLQKLVRHHDVRYVHPHMGSFSSWALASLVARATGADLRVIGPHPQLARAVNDKVWFADAVRRVFGEEWIPHTGEAYNLATLSHWVRTLSADGGRLVIKLPDSAGGGGNLVLAAAQFEDLELGAIRARLKRQLEPLEWDGRGRLLIGRWEDDVLASPSAQLWLPPSTEGPPLIEGIFEQILEGPHGLFVGNSPARLPAELTQEIADRSWLLALLFQRLGYVGRCSFDLLLVGKDQEHCRPEFIECNGRWGGTSLPMTLMNRAFGDWRERDYCCFEYKLPGSLQGTFSATATALGDDLFELATGQGHFLLYNPGSLVNGEIGVIGLQEDCALARERIDARLNPPRPAHPPAPPPQLVG